MRAPQWIWSKDIIRRKSLPYKTLNKRGVHGGPEPDCRVEGWRCSPGFRTPDQVTMNCPVGQDFQGYIPPNPDVRGSCFAAPTISSPSVYDVTPILNRYTDIIATTT